VSKYLSAAALLAAALSLSGCATKMDMPYSSNQPSADPAKGVYLMTLTTKNTYHTSFQPDMLVINVEKVGAQSSADRLNFVIDDAGKNETGSADTGNTYLIRMQLPPGDYMIHGVTCLNRQFPIIASFFVPLHEKLTVSAAGVYYLGHVDGTVRERVGDEFKAGPTLPLIDEAVAGASGGTFDVVISDQWDKDSQQFVAKFPSLQGINVQKAIMAPFDRALAQKLWEAS
jgi:hypothetical protein